MWLDGHPNGALVRNASELNQIDPDKVDYLLGLMAEEHIQWADQRIPGLDPSLKEMATKAIEVTRKKQFLQLI